MVPKADEEIGTEAHPLPADEHEEVVVGQDEKEHREHEEVQIGEVAGVARVPAHVPGRVDVDDEPHSRHHEEHHGAEGSRRNATSARKLGAAIHSKRCTSPLRPRKTAW